MPRLKPVNIQALERAGYAYDASLNLPPGSPGRYNNRHLPRTVRRKEALGGTLRLRTLRLPVFWRF